MLPEVAPKDMKVFKEPRDVAQGRAAHVENSTENMGNLALVRVNQEAKQIKATFPLQTLQDIAQICSINKRVSVVYLYWWLDYSGLEGRFSLALERSLYAVTNVCILAALNKTMHRRFNASSGLPWWKTMALPSAQTPFNWFRHRACWCAAACCRGMQQLLIQLLLSNRSCGTRVGTYCHTLTLESWGYLGLSRAAFVVQVSAIEALRMLAHVSEFRHVEIMFRHAACTVQEAQEAQGGSRVGWLGHPTRQLLAGMIRFILLQNRQGKTRLSKWYVPFNAVEKFKIESEIHRAVVTRDPRNTNFLEYRSYKIIYRRYAGMFFIFCASWRSIV